MNNNKLTIPVNVDLRVAEIERISDFIDQVLRLGEKIHSNQEQLSGVQDTLRMVELKSCFYTIAEVADALHCTQKTAMKFLREKDVPIIDRGKTYVVFKENLMNAFREAS